MKTISKTILVGCTAAFYMAVSLHPSIKTATATASTIVTADDPLPSWNDPLKSQIIAFVNKVSTPGSPDFVPLKSRIATIDNDGTLWAEKPFVQELFALSEVKKMVMADTSLARKQPFKAVVEHDKAYFEKGGEKALFQLIIATHTGMTEDQFETTVQNWFATAKYPRAGGAVSLSKIVYQPQLELLNYLRASGFKVFIVTGGTIEFVRAISDSFYGVPKENVVGTTFKYKFNDSTSTIMREPSIDLLDDKEGKPVGIQTHIGQRPIFSMGNEGGQGDIAMCKYCQSNRYPSFQMIVNHDDSTREYYYQEKDSASLKACAKYNWHVLSMKNDWKIIFPQ